MALELSYKHNFEFCLADSIGNSGLASAKFEKLMECATESIKKLADKSHSDTQSLFGLVRTCEDLELLETIAEQYCEFFDHVIGVSLLNSDIVRKNSGNTNTQTGDRDGKQIFSSLKFGREFEYNDMNITPTGRMDGSFTHLNAYTESGNEAIKYNEQDIVSLMTSLGMMIDRDISLCNYTTGNIHLCYISTRNSVKKIKQEKKYTFGLVGSVCHRWLLGSLQNNI